MFEYCIPFIKQEDFESHIAKTIASYNETLKSIDLVKFNSNIIDPIKLTFDKKLFKKSMEEIIELEIHRQRDKSNTNAAFKPDKLCIITENVGNIITIYDKKRKELTSF